jgi:hypothetical protein
VRAQVIVPGFIIRPGGQHVARSEFSEIHVANLITTHDPRDLMGGSMRWFSYDYPVVADALGGGHIHTIPSKIVMKGFHDEYSRLSAINPKPRRVPVFFRARLHPGDVIGASQLASSRLEILDAPLK